jgi:hypothetical protein
MEAGILRGDGRTTALAIALIALLAVGIGSLGAARAGASGTVAMERKDEAVKVEVRKRGGQVSAQVVTPTTPQKLKVRLNGRNLSDIFAFRPAVAGPVTLGRGDGLRAGRNMLKAEATFPSGRTKTREVMFRVSSRWPLPNAGRDREVFGGDRLRLSAAGTLAPGKGKFRYLWKVTSRPPGSKPKLTRARTARPSLKTNTPGVYRIRLAVRRGKGPVGYDVVEVSANDPKLTRAGMFVSTAPFGPGAAGGPATSLNIYGGSAAGSYPIGNQQKGPVVTLFFDRSTMGLVGGPYYTGASVEDGVNLINLYSAAIKSTGQTPLVVTAGNDYGPMSIVFGDDWLWDQLGARNMIDAPSSFALAGVGWPPGSGSDPPLPNSLHYIAPDTEGDGRLSGQILPDASQNWSFVPSDLPAFGTPLVPFDTSTSGNSIEVAGQTFAQDARPPGCPGAGGFQVLGVAASAPNPLQPVAATVNEDSRTFQNGETFWTNACALGPNDAHDESIYQQVAMLEMLEQLESSSRPLLVFVQSVGNVGPTVTGDYFSQYVPVNRISEQISNLGGSAGTFLNLFGGGQTGYSLVGQTFNDYGMGTRVADAEAATNQPTSPAARLIGFMRRDPIGRYLPSISSAGDAQRAANFKQEPPQSEIAREVNTSTWSRTPFPNEGDPAWTAALQDLALVAGLAYNPSDDVPCYRPPGGNSDIRSNYCGGVPEGETVDTYWQNVVLPAVEAAPYSQNPDYTSAEFAQVKAQLAIEFKLVDAANEAANALSQSFSASQSNDAKSITATYVQAVEQAAKNAQLEAQPTNLGWIGEVFDLAAALTGFVTDEISGVLWTISASLANESFIAADGTGRSVVSGLTGSLSGSPDQAAGAIASQISNQVTVANQARFAIADAIVSDWSRLQQATADLANVPDTEAITNATNALRYAGVRYVWRDLVESSATVYATINSTINVYNSTGLQPAYDQGFIKNYGCWLSGTGIFKDGESIEKVFGDAPNGSIYPDQRNLYADQVWDSWTPYVLTVGGKNPSGGGSNPATSPAAQYYALFLPDSIVNPFTAAPPGSVNPLSPVVNGGPPGLGYGYSQFFDRLFLGKGQTASCHGPRNL